MSPLSLQYRLNKRLVSGIAALLVIFGAALGYLLVRDLAREFDRSLESKARALLDLSQRRMARVDLADGIVLEPEDGSRPTYFAIRSADGTVLEQSHAQHPLSSSAAGGPGSLLRFTNVTLPGGVSGRQVEIDFVTARSSGDPADPATIATVIVAEPRAALFWKIARACLTLLGLGLVLLLALVGVVRNALRRGLEPIIGLRRQMETLDSEPRGQRVNLQAPPEELAPIMHRINDLLERAEVAVPSRRTAAH